jgi:hypothetical protein
VSAASARPTAGVRFAVVWAEADTARVVYRGFAHLPDADLPLEVTITLPSGATRASIMGGTPEMEKVAAALVRAATKAEINAGAALPRKIVRWRG